MDGIDVRKKMFEYVVFKRAEHFLQISRSCPKISVHTKKIKGPAHRRFLFAEMPKLWQRLWRSKTKVFTRLSL